MKYIFVSGGRFTTFASIMNNHPKSPIIDLQQQQLLLRMEYEHEKEEFKRQTETMGVARKVKRGLCWYPASPGRSYYNSLNQLVIDITRTENKEIEHSFEFGRPVCFFRQSFDGKVNYMNFIATVSYADDERMVVVLPSAGALLELQTEEVLGVQLYFDETSYRAMFEALEDTIRAKGNRLAELRDTLLGTQKPGFRELYPVRFPWLNSTQETAVNKVLCTRDVAIVHGPPGTGKSQTITNIIANALYKGKRVLFVAEKMAALSVVQNRLAAIGLAPFCLEIHSNKTKKSTVISQLKETTEIIRRTPPEEFRKEAERLLKLRTELNKYIEALHKEYPFGLSLYDAIIHYQLTDVEPCFDIPSSYLDNLDKDRFSHWEDAIESLVSTANACGHPYLHPLTGIFIREYSSAIKEEALQTLATFIGLLTAIQSKLPVFSALLENTDIHPTRKDFNIISAIIRKILDIPELTPELLTTPLLNEMLEEYRKVTEHGRKRDEIKA